MMNTINVYEVFKTPVKRSELPVIFNCSDRAARKIISILMEEYNIVNLQDGKGYVLADDETAVKYALQERHRGIMSLKKANKILARCQSESFDTIVPVKAHFRRLKKNMYFNKNQIDLF